MWLWRSLVGIVTPLAILAMFVDKFFLASEQAHFRSFQRIWNVSARLRLLRRGQIAWRVGERQNGLRCGRDTAGSASALSRISRGSAV
jgi:hypothetical protein